MLFGWLIDILDQDKHILVNPGYNSKSAQSGVKW